MQILIGFVTRIISGRIGILEMLFKNHRIAIILCLILGCDQKENPLNIKLSFGQYFKMNYKHIDNYLIREMK